MLKAIACAFSVSFLVTGFCLLLIKKDFKGCIYVTGTMIIWSLQHKYNEA